MRQKFLNLVVNTSGQRLYEITDQTIKWIKKNNFTNGILNLSIQHTSASLIVQENADPDVQKDLINYFDKLVNVGAGCVNTGPYHLSDISKVRHSNILKCHYSDISFV